MFLKDVRKEFIRSSLKHRCLMIIQYSSSQWGPPAPQEYDGMVITS